MQGYPKRKQSERDRIAAAFRSAFKDIGILERRWQGLPEDVRLANPDIGRWFDERSSLSSLKRAIGRIESPAGLVP